jgi:hypothetical protein
MINADGFLKEFSLDTASMEKLLKEEKMFKLSVEKNESGQYGLSMKSYKNLDRSTVISELEKVTNNK